jgi:hypothetical protein
MPVEVSDRMKNKGATLLTLQDHAACYYLFDIVFCL